MRKRYSYILLAAAALSSCTSQSDTATDGHGHGHDDHGHGHGHESSHTEELHVSQNRRDKMGITVGVPEMLFLNSAVQSSGSLEVPPNHRATVGSLVEGRIARINVLQGDRVRKGQTLAIIEHPDIIEMQEQTVVAKSAMELAEIQFKRDERLFKDSAISNDEFIQSRSEFQSAQAVYTGFRTKIRLMNLSLERILAGEFSSGAPIVSPIDGYVHLILVKNGSYVMAAAPLFDIVNNEHIHIDLSIYERDINKVKKGNTVVFTTLDQKDKVFRGQIFAVGKTFEQEPRVMTVHAEIDNKDGSLLPGMYVEARILVDSSRNLTVPNDAICEKEGKYFVFKVSKEEKDHFELVEVRKGVSDIGFTQVKAIKGEIYTEDSIVTAGAYYMLAEMDKSEREHSH